MASFASPLNELNEYRILEEDFRKHCQVVIDNSKDLEETQKQIDKILGERLWKM